MFARALLAFDSTGSRNAMLREHTQTGARLRLAVTCSRPDDLSLIARRSVFVKSIVEHEQCLLADGREPRNSARESAGTRERLDGAGESTRWILRYAPQRPRLETIEDRFPRLVL